MEWKSSFWGKATFRSDSEVESREVPSQGAAPVFAAVSLWNSPSGDATELVQMADACVENWKMPMLQAKYYATFWAPKIIGFSSNKMINMNDGMVERKMWAFLYLLLLCCLSSNGKRGSFICDSLSYSKLFYRRLKNLFKYAEKNN